MTSTPSTSQAQHADDTARQVLIIKLGAFGDVILCQHQLQAIRSRHPNARITVLTTKPFVKIMDRCPWIDAVIVDPRKPRWRFWEMLPLRAELKKLPPIDHVYDLMGEKGRTRVYRQWIAPKATSIGASHLVPGPYSPVDMSWFMEPVDEVLGKHGFNEGFVLLIPGCSASNAHKRWPHYDQLAKRLNEAGFNCVTAPGPDELELCRSIPATMLMQPTDEGEKPLTFFQLAALAGKARYVIGNDTGPTHLAATVGTPGLALFSGRSVSAKAIGIDRVWSVIQAEDEIASIKLDEVASTALADLKST